VIEVAEREGGASCPQVAGSRFTVRARRGSRLGQVVGSGERLRRAVDPWSSAGAAHRAGGHLPVLPRRGVAAARCRRRCVDVLPARPAVAPVGAHVAEHQRRSRERRVRPSRAGRGRRHRAADIPNRGRRARRAPRRGRRPSVATTSSSPARSWRSPAPRGRRRRCWPEVSKYRRPTGERSKITAGGAAACGEALPRAATAPLPASPPGSGSRTAAGPFAARVVDATPARLRRRGARRSDRCR